MKQTLLLVIIIFLFAGCDKNKIESDSNCTYAGVTLTRTHNFVDNIPATVAAVKHLNQPETYQIIPSENNSWGSCNLPQEFAKDSLKVFVSGYFLSFPEMETMNISPVPFEVTDIKPRE